jgi:hypothetical protein
MDKKEYYVKVEALQASERGGIPMAKQGKNAMEDFPKMFEGTPCAEMMRKMMEGKAGGQCFSCAEMMPQMIQRWCGAKGEKEANSKETKETHPSTV